MHHLARRTSLVGRQPAALRRGGWAGRGEVERGEEERWRGNRRERERERSKG